ncbi:MAG: CPBP family intramembrane glutamic endopeptidase [Luteimonas sp.]
MLRVAAVGVLGPIAEELIFRGFLFARMLRAGINVHATIALLAAGWALLHWSYSLPVIAVIFVAGILLGLARWRTNSVIVPAAMHIIWNLFAVW